ncbi:UNVERIFIED_ORG: hypothetical protein GGI63_000297 [Rhizobium esperanzae]
MTGFAIVQERAFAAALEEMTDDELFNLMRDLEMRGEALDRPSPADEIFAKLVLTESAIERRFPGQMLRPYKDWLPRPERSKRRVRCKAACRSRERWRPSLGGIPLRAGRL